MELVQLGKSSLYVSKLAFGCMSLENDFRSVEKLLNKAVDSGVNYFDTADIYSNGQNEVLVGKALRYVRKQIVIATKGGNELNADGKGWKWNPTKNYIIEACEASLKRLQTDYIDLYQLHGGTIHDPLDDTIEAFETLQEQGKIRHYGISSIRPNVIKEYVKRSSMVSVMMQYSLADRRPEEAILTLLHESNIGVLARGTVANGLLVDKPAKDYAGYTKLEISLIAEAIKNISANKTEALTAIKYVLNNKAITAAVAGIRTFKHLEEAINAVQSEPLSHDKVVMLQNTVPANLYREHR